MVTGYAILESYDFNNYKPKIAQAVKEATGRELKIDGDIKVKLGLSPESGESGTLFNNLIDILL